MYSNYQQFPGALPAGGTTLTAASELAYQESQPDQSIPPAPQGRVIRGYINATGGATGGAWSIKCRQGAGTGGTQVGNTQSYTFPATTTVSIPYSFNDTSATAPQNGLYTITVTAAGSNGTANDGAMEVFVSDPFGGES
jgi:hypothetical protein